MKKFLKQLLYFTIPIVFLFIFILIPYPILDNEVLNSELERKITDLKIDTSKVNIVVAGDSRAERQLIPEVISKNTGFKVINIGASSCDLATVVAAIKKYYNNNPKIFFVISASSWQINDGANDPGYLSLKCFQKFKTTEKLILYRNELPEMGRMQTRLFEQFTKKVFNKKDVMSDKLKTNKELGFYGIEGLFKVKSKNLLREEFAYHPWYKNVSNNGSRWNIFQESLAEIKKMNSFFLIYQPPISQYWRTSTANSFIDKAEVEYSRKLSNEVQGSKNIEFLDFYNNEIAELNDSMYYDYQHLNRKGAETFSTLISKKIMTAYQKYYKLN